MEKVNVDILVDTNHAETPFAEGFEALGFNVVRQTLKTGDFVVRSAKWHVVIERKSVADLLTSYTGYVKNRQTRWTTERLRLAGLQDDHPNVISVLLLHGARPDIDPGKRYGHDGNVTGEEFNAGLLHTAFNYRVHVVNYTSAEDAIKWVGLVARQMQAGKIREEEGDANAEPPNMERKPPALASPQVSLAKMLSSLHGMSPQKAQSVVEVYPTMGALVQADERLLAKVKTPKGNLGPAMAKRIVAMF